ncbi:MAG: M13 family metallopeptidase N-terminal domain-containing protein, partial [Chthoniobacterales bacterium]
MFKSISVLVAGFVGTVTLQAQTAPANSKPLGAATPPPSVHKASKPPTGDKIPPPATVGGTTADAKVSAAGLENQPAFDLKNMDKAVKPADDFYTYANGTWLKKNPIPPEESRWGSFNALIEKNAAALKVVAENAAKKTGADAAPDVQKVGDYYASGMDEKAIDAAKATPLDEEFKKIEAISDPEGMLKEVAHLHTLGVSALFGFTSGQDDKNSSMNISQAYQGGLGMPDRDYYTKEDDASKKIRAAYVEHVTKMMTLMGDPAPKAAEEAKAVLAVETGLAKPARTRVELRDPQKNYNKMSMVDLQAMMPNWNWMVYFREIGLENPGDINVGQPDFFKGMNDLVR